jgi:hypothetical protein
MKKLSVLIALMMAASPVFANEDKITQGYKSMDSLGCLLLGECTDNVDPIWGIDYLVEEYPLSDYAPIAEEFSRMLNALTMIDVQVYLADEKYFPPGHRGVYHTVTNTFYLNDSYMFDPATLMSVMRHEGWHAAQDCMAGTIDNSMIALIMPEDNVPMLWREMVERTYPESAWPWEKEATWAGKTENMTMEALEACEGGAMWEIYTPTPKTREWLQRNGYLTGG